jgi:Protein of unknown function (DUF4232)
MLSSLVSPRRAVGAAAIACVAAMAAGCSSPGPSTTPVKTITVTASAASVTPVPPPAVPAPTQAATSPAGAAPCPTRDLGVKLGLGQGAMGSTYTVIDFTNIGTVTCTLYGYPGVSLAGGHPVTQIGAAADENPGTPRHLVTLAPGAVANALLRIEHAQILPASQCDPVNATYLQIFPPNQITPVYLAYSGTACAKSTEHILTINVVIPGSGGG